MYIRSIFEYGSIAFLHILDSTLNILQKVQNKALRIALRLPKYVSVKLLYDSACLLIVKERLEQFGAILLGTRPDTRPSVTYSWAGAVMLKNRQKSYFYESVTDGRTDGPMETPSYWEKNRN